MQHLTYVFRFFRTRTGALPERHIPWFLGRGTSRRRPRVDHLLPQPHCRSFVSGGDPTPGRPSSRMAAGARRQALRLLPSKTRARDGFGDVEVHLVVNIDARYLVHLQRTNATGDEASRLPKSTALRVVHGPVWRV